MAIKNEPKITNREDINILRSQMEQRAQWLSFIMDEAEAKGVDIEEICRDAIYKVGCFRGADIVKNAKDKSDLVEVSEYFKNHANYIAFEKEVVTATPDHLEIRHYHCPLVTGWQKAGKDEATISKLCEIAMCGDHGMFTNIKDAKFTLASTLADGDDCCTLILDREKK
ncbi:MAG: L-2-amino-thiazoline-4-carboxylic acid hydrolase [Acetivibrionales bacterium]